MKSWKKQCYALCLAGSLLLTTAYGNEYITNPNNEGTTEGEEGPSYAGPFADIEGHWAEQTIINLFSKGLVSGVDEINFAPNTTMSRAEFITVVVRNIYPTAEFFKGTYWYSGYFETAQAEGLLPMTFREKNMEQAITRQEMAYIMVAALEDMGQYQTELLSTKVIPDYSSITSTYQEAVIKAFSMGLISGKDEAMTFYPNDTATRAECTIVLEKMVSPETRLEVDFSVNPNAMTDMNRLDVSYTKSRENLSYNLTDPLRPIAKVGDTIVTGSGTVTVEAHPSLASVNGMAVPYMAGTALDSGINTNSVHGTVGDGFVGGGVHYNGETYYINPQTKEGYWESQWEAIALRVSAPRISGTAEGQVSTDAYKMWTWSMENRKWVVSYLYGRT